MPAKNKTSRPQHEIDRFVWRHLRGGEPVISLAKEAKISKPGFYLWERKFKQSLLDGSRKIEMSPQAKEASELLTLRLEIQRLNQENASLRNKVVDFMIKCDDL